MNLDLLLIIINFSRNLLENNKQIDSGILRQPVNMLLCLWKELYLLELLRVAIPIDFVFNLIKPVFVFPSVIFVFVVSFYRKNRFISSRYFVYWFYWLKYHRFGVKASLILRNDQHLWFRFMIFRFWALICSGKMQYFFHLV